MKKLFLSLVLVFTLIVPLTASDQLDEANATFSYKGKPIHPFLVKEFSNWISDDRPPVVTRVDAAAAFDTKEYPQSGIEARNEWWFAEQQEKDGIVTLYESFGYHWLGRLANGIHVIEAGASGGGSGFFMDLILLRFTEGEIILENTKEKQLLMSLVGIYSLGDRYEGDIKVFPEKVFIPASKRQAGGGSVEKDIELKFPVR